MRNRRVRRIAITLSLVAAIMVAAPAMFVWLVDVQPQRLALPDNLVVTDRDGHVLRSIPDERGERHTRVDLEQTSTLLQHAFLAAEDARFEQHHGVDLRAVARAAWQNLRARRTVSGASTLTQQVIRLGYPRPRTLTAKLVETARAVKLERQLSKDEILELYLNRAPLGINLVGVGVASRVYFDTVPQRLTAEQCALLAALPKAPSALDPYQGDPARLLARRNWVLDRMLALGYLDQAEHTRARARPVDVRPRRFPMQAPHAVDLILARHAPRHGSVATTLNAALQARAEKVLRSHRVRLHEHGARQAAAMIVHTPTRDVLALVGSLEYAARDQGYNNGALAPRSPGSALKPFLYGLALDQGHTAADRLRDRERTYLSGRGVYLPRNYDRQQYGEVSLRTALAGSLNLSALELLEQLGVERFHAQLRELDLIHHPTRGPQHYGLGLAIGNPEVTLEQLVAAYAALVDGGRWRPLRYRPSDPLGPPRVAMSPQAAFIIHDILSDPAARSLTFASAHARDAPHPLAWKTGTSTYYRDGWAIAVTPQHTIGVWVGNFDGSPTKELSGVVGAGGILADLARALYNQRSPQGLTPPAGVIQAQVCADSGTAPGPGCVHRQQEWFMQGGVPMQPCLVHEGAARASRPESSNASPVAMAHPAPPANTRPPRITHPLPDDGFVLTPGMPNQAIVFQARTAPGAGALTWYLNGSRLDQTTAPHTLTWPMRRGHHSLMAVDADNLAGAVMFRVE